MSATNTKKNHAQHNAAVKAWRSGRADLHGDAARSLSIAGVSELTNLGHGYLIIKVDGKCLPGMGHTLGDVAQPAHDEAVPTIPLSQVKRLLAQCAAQPAGAAVPAAVVDPDNQAFMDNMNREAMQARARLVADGVLLTSAQLCERLHISRQAVSKAIKEFRLFALAGPSGRQLYPAFFTDMDSDRRVLERVSQELGDLPGPSKWQFFTTAKASLRGQTPLSALKQGQVEPVLAAAAGFRER